MVTTVENEIKLFTAMKSIVTVAVANDHFERDESGRPVAPKQEMPTRPAGPWDNNRTLVMICAWCPDSKVKTAAALRAGKTVTHGMCPSCLATMEAVL